MTIYTQKVIDYLNGMTFRPNILEEYDNVVYNIRLYMLPSAYEQAVTVMRSIGDNVRVDENKKVIIAQTGVSSKLSVERLQIDTKYSHPGATFSVSSTSLTLQLKEVNTCTFINKIAATTKLLGYDNMTLIPCWLDVWFSGYDNKTGQPVEKIGEVMNYSVAITSVKTSVNDTGTIFDISLNRREQVAMTKDVILLNDIGAITTKSGNIREFTARLEEYVNEKYFNQYPSPESIKQLFPNKKMLNITLVDNNPSFYYKNSIVDDSIEFTTDMRTSDDVLNKTERNIGSMFLAHDISHKYTQSNEEINFKSSSFDTLENIFQELCFICPELQDDVAKPVYDIVSVGTYNGCSQFQVNMKVMFCSNKYMKWFREKNKIETSIEDIQLATLEEYDTKGSLVKRYDYNFSGTDTSILELETEIDGLWYVNSAINNKSSLASSGVDTLTIKEELNNKRLQNIIQMTTDERKEHLKLLENSQYDPSYNSSIDGRIYMDDIYSNLSDTKKITLLGSREIPEKSDPLALPNIDLTDAQTVDFLMSKVGFANASASGQLVSIQFRILGDPYWLWLQTYTNNYAMAQGTKWFSSMYQFLFTMKTGVELDEENNYSMENVSEFSSIYQLKSSLSVFENGKFTQTLSGSINPVFNITPFYKGI